VAGLVSEGGRLAGATDALEGRLGPRRHLVEQRPPPHPQPGAHPRERRVPRLKVGHRGVVLQQPVAALQRPGVLAALVEVGGEAVEDAAVEEGAPALGSALHHREVVRREGHHRDAPEVGLERGGPLAVDEGGAGPGHHLDGDVAHRAVQEEAPRDAAGRLAELHQLGEAARPQRLQRGEEVHALEEVRLALPVLPHGDGRVGRGLQGGTAEVAEALVLDGQEAQTRGLPGVSKGADAPAPSLALACTAGGAALQLGRSDPRPPSTAGDRARKAGGGRRVRSDGWSTAPDLRSRANRKRGARACCDCASSADR